MSLFGGPHDESSPHHSGSDTDEIREIPESPSHGESEEQDDDDLDEVYSDDDYEEDSDDEGSTLKTPLTERELKRYRRWYRAELNLVDAFETARSGDLGRHLLGFASERRVQLSKEPAKGVKSWASRARWTRDGGARRAIPGASWTAWPLRVGEVPGAGERFGKGGFLGEERVEWVSGEFEEVLCDVGIGMARERVVREARVGGLDGVESCEDSDGEGEDEDDSDDAKSKHDQASTQTTTAPMVENPSSFFSTDQDHARNILQPTVRSLISKVDTLLTALYHSRLNHRAHRSASAPHHDNDANPATPRRPKSSSGSEGEKKEALGLRDWSELLGMASSTGWDPEIVGRAAERCSKLFGEGMAFATFDVDVDVDTNVTSAPQLCVYTPTSIPPHVLGGEAKGEDKWTLDSLFCPHEDCPRHVRKFGLRRRLRWHVKGVHDWDPEVEERPREVVGGVRVDGFLRPITAQPGWRARDREKSERRGVKRKRVKGGGEEGGEGDGGGDG
ncbi:hypothetical protein FKW77_009967 [Venturia effusa]|uniref:Uncharacterized protein n=1 Tax=Venturia effusa TaxID=50376 RepID=A0A517L0A1_9PEZI|nr:hypothetical protein FKW77_009967 [Venturia effusa]